MKQKLFLMAAAIMFYCGIRAGDIPEPMNPPRLVNDYVNLLDDNTKAAMEQQLLNFEKQTSIQIAVVIVDHVTDGDKAQEATDIGQHWGVGNKALDNGVVYFLSVSDRHVFIATGRGVEEYLPDITCKQICDQVCVPFLKQHTNEGYIEGTKAGVQAIIATLGTIPLADRIEQTQRIKAAAQAKETEEVDMILSILSGVVCAALLIFLIVWRGRRVIDTRKTIARLRKHYDLIIADEWDPLTQPEWVRDEGSSAISAYQEAKSRASRLVSQMPTSAISIALFKPYPFESTEAAINELDELHRPLVKLGDDAELYKARAPKAVEQVTAMLKSVQESVSEDPDYIKALSPKVEEIAEKVSKIPTVGTDTYRDAYLSAYALNVELKKLSRGLLDRIQAKSEVVDAAKSFQQQNAKAKSLNDKYASLYPSLSKYPRTVLDRVRTVAYVVELASYVQSKHDQVLTMINSADPDRYVNASVELTKANDNLTKLQQQVDTLNGVLTDLSANQKGYPSKTQSVEKAIAAAKAAVTDSDVSTDTQSGVSKAQAKLDEARRNANRDFPDWILVAALLSEAASIATTTVSSADSDKHEASIKRSKAAQARSSSRSSSSSNYSSNSRNDDSYMSSSVFTSTSNSWSSGGSDSGSFGGFGGGSFGGGGGGSDF